MKRLLIDTHILLWWLSDNPSLGVEAKKHISDGRNEIYVSGASTWEISIKKAIGKLSAPDDMDKIIEEERFLKLPISLYHGQMAGRLPSHHRDPFDRMLIAQAQAEGLILVTTDLLFQQYGIHTLAGGK